MGQHNPTMDKELFSMLDDADQGLRSTISTGRSGFNSTVQQVEDAKTSVYTAADTADDMYGQQVKGFMDHLKTAREQYPAIILGAATLGIALPSARLGMRRFLRNTTLTGATTCGHVPAVVGQTKLTVDSSTKARLN